MKKFNVIFGTVLVGGMLLAGCSEGEDEAKTVQANEAEDQSKEIIDLSQIEIEEDTRLDILFEDIRSWAMASEELLSAPIDPNDEKGKELALKARKVTYSFPQKVITEKGLDSEEGEIHSKTFLLASEIMFRQHIAESAKDYDELRAKFDELKQYIEEVANNYL